MPVWLLSVERITPVVQNFNISLPYSFAFSYSPKNKKCNYVAIDVKIKKEIKDVNITMVSEQIVDDEIYEEENEEINEEEEIYEEEEIIDWSHSVF